MKNQWLLAGVISILIGILIAIGYLAYVGVFYDTTILREHPLDPSARALLQFIGGMLGVSLLLNLCALLEFEQHWQRLMVWLRADHAVQVKQQFQSDLQKFVHHQELQILPQHPQRYLQLDEKNQLRKLICIDEESDHPLSIFELRNIFQQMLRYQCRSGVLLCLAGVDPQAGIFAKEAGIEVFNYKQLKKQLNC